jgi:hypothetical protein
VTVVGMPPHDMSAHHAAVRCQRTHSAGGCQAPGRDGVPIPRDLSPVASGWSSLWVWEPPDSYYCRGQIGGEIVGRKLPGERGTPPGGCGCTFCREEGPSPGGWWALSGKNYGTSDPDFHAPGLPRCYPCCGHYPVVGAPPPTLSILECVAD